MRMKLNSMCYRVLDACTGMHIHIKTQVSREAYRYLTACSDQYIYTQYQEILPQYLVKKKKGTRLTELLRWSIRIVQHMYMCKCM